MHLCRCGVVVGVVVGAVVVPLVAALALRLSVGVELGVEGARRQRDDASELGEALVLGGHELARALGRRRVLLDDERAEVGAVGQLRAGAQLRPQRVSLSLSHFSLSLSYVLLLGWHPTVSTR